jgi:hypothetical protein
MKCGLCGYATKGKYCTECSQFKQRATSYRSDPYGDWAVAYASEIYDRRYLDREAQPKSRANVERDYHGDNRS